MTVMMEFKKTKNLKFGGLLRFLGLTNLKNLGFLQQCSSFDSLCQLAVGKNRKSTHYGRDFVPYWCVTHFRPTVIT